MEGNIHIDDPQQKYFISYLLAELLLIELRPIIKLEIIGEDGSPRVIFEEWYLFKWQAGFIVPALIYFIEPV